MEKQSHILKIEMIINLDAEYSSLNTIAQATIKKNNNSIYTSFQAQGKNPTRLGIVSIDKSNVSAEVSGLKAMEQSHKQI